MFHKSVVVYTLKCYSDDNITIFLTHISQFGCGLRPATSDFKPKKHNWWLYPLLVLLQRPVGWG